MNQNLTLTFPRPKYLGLLMMSYTLALFAANWFDPRQIKILGLCTGAGSIAFPLTYLLADVITEVYGYKQTRIAILTGFLFYFSFLLYGQFVVFFISPSSPDQNSLTLFLHVNNRIMFAALATYFGTESANSYFLAKLKIYFQGKYIGFRFVISTLLAYVVNDLIYDPIAFYGLMPLKDFFIHVGDSWVFMVSIELILVSVSVRIAKRMKVIERSDIYDFKTRFNPFSLNTYYSKEDNRYRD